jgi:hypothetical protein
MELLFEIGFFKLQIMDRFLYFDLSRMLEVIASMCIGNDSNRN